MRKINFTKMHACGNDYIYISGADVLCAQELAQLLTNRNTSIGGDGIVLLFPSDVADIKIRIYNPDGSEAMMCGSSIRCVGKYLHDRDIVKKNRLSVETVSGIKDIIIVEDGGNSALVQVDMGQVVLQPSKIPVDISGEMAVARSVNIDGKTYEITCVSMGTPHAVIFVDDLDHFALKATGLAFENSPLFPEGINLGVAQIIDRQNIALRVWERGTGETMSSGTSACAATVAAVLMGYADKESDITVAQAGGALAVNYSDKSVLLTGACVKSYEGVVEV